MNTCPTAPTVTTEQEGRVTVHRPAVALIVEGPEGRPVLGSVIWEGCETFRTVAAARRAAVDAWTDGDHLEDLAEAVEVEA